MSYRTFLAVAFCAFAFSAFAQPAPTASAPAEVDVAVTARDLPRGSVLTEADLGYKPMAVARANDSIARSIADVVGMETRRALRAGEPIRNIDIKRHALVAKGATVTMLFEAEGLTLTFVGRAMGDGAEGDVITVLNPSSYRQVQAIVTAPGTVRVGSAPQGGVRVSASR
jgi:flagellar basal body P-ring formation protein FlgA